MISDTLKFPNHICKLIADYSIGSLIGNKLSFQIDGKKLKIPFIETSAKTDKNGKVLVWFFQKCRCDLNSQKKQNLTCE